MYTCKECGLGVIVLDTGEVIKACPHNAPILGEMQAVTYSHGRLQ